MSALECKLEEAKAALASETTNLKLRLNESEKLLSVQQQQQQQQQVQVQQQQQECARQGRERVFIEHKIAMLDQQQSAAAAAEAAAAARGDAERAATAALERVSAVSAVLKKMANLDEGLEGDCTCLQCMQSLADPVLLQVMAALHQAPPRDF